MRVGVVTGLSGAGKTTVLHVLEDLNHFCVDNLPLPLVGKFIELLEGNNEIEKVALVVDAREGEFLRDYQTSVDALRQEGHTVDVLFLDATDERLIRRFSETRRRHPVSPDDVRDGIKRERELLRPLAADPHAVRVDTTDLSVHSLKDLVQARYGRATAALRVTVLSFGYKHGIPSEADLAFDVRFLPNPHFVEALSPLTGLDDRVAQFALGNTEAETLIAHIEKLLVFSLPLYQREGKAYLTVAIGCTGGRHRSVALAQELSTRLAGKWPVAVRHRDLHGGAPAAE